MNEQVQQPTLFVRDEGTVINTTPLFLDFVGSGVTASTASTAGTIRVTIPGATSGGAGSFIFTNGQRVLGRSATTGGAGQELTGVQVLNLFATNLTATRLTLNGRVVVGRTATTIGRGTGLSPTTFLQSFLASRLTATCVQMSVGKSVVARTATTAGRAAAVTLTVLLDIIGSTWGNVLYRASGVWTALPVGASGAFLQTKGASASPVWTLATSVIGGSEWNPADSSATSTVIGPDGRTVMNGASATYGSVRATQSRSSGKYYFEFKMNSVAASPGPGVGVGSASATLSDYVGSDANAWSIWPDGFARHNGSTTVENTYAAGDIVGVAVDFTASTGSIAFYKNNTAQTNAFTGLTLSAMYPMASCRGNTTVNGGTLRLKAAEQTYSPPAGYTAWL